MLEACGNREKAIAAFAKHLPAIGPEIAMHINKNIETCFAEDVKADTAALLALVKEYKCVNRDDVSVAPTAHSLARLR